ncbi:hypothetical protein CQ10_01820 [Bradyrhizobium valentinum]|nr:hypothetical protein CQ10_01820 [Bradyrhizobium valentinum]
MLKGMMFLVLSRGKRPWPAQCRIGRAVSVGDFRPHVSGQRDQHARKKTDAILEVRIIMANLI